MSAEAQALTRLLAGAWVAQAISVVAQFGIADLLRNGPRSVAELAKASGTQAAALHRVLRALAAEGIFAEQTDGRFALTALAEPLCSEAEGSLRAYAVMMGGELVWRSWGAMAHSLRTGRPGFEQVFGMRTFDYYAAHPEVALTYTEGLASISARQDAAIARAYDFSGVGRVVDVGGGRGGLLSALLDAWPKLEGVLLDMPHAVAAAVPLLAAYGARCAVVAGDFFAAVPEGADAYVLKKVIHDWEDQRALEILRQCRAAMGPRARLLLCEFLITPGNAPSYAKLLDLLMLVYAGGRERTEAEHRGLLAEAGLRLMRVIPTGTAISILEAVPEA